MTMTLDNPTTTDVSDVSAIRQQALQNSVILVSPSIGWWRGRYHLHDVRTAAGDKNLSEDDVTTPQAKLLTTSHPLDDDGVPWLKRFQKAGQKLEKIKQRYSLPFSLSGVRLVPKNRGADFLAAIYGPTVGKLRSCWDRAEAPEGSSMHDVDQQLQEARRRYGENVANDTPVYDLSKDDTDQSPAYELFIAAEEFCQNWDRIRRQLEEHSDVYSLVKDSLPQTGRELRSKFYLTVLPIELAGSTGAESTDYDTLQQHSDIVREACRRCVEDAIETMVAVPRQQLSESLSGLLALMQRGGKVTAKSFKPIRAAIEQIRLFDCVADNVLLRQIHRLEAELEDTSPQELASNERVAAQFSDVVRELDKDITSAEAQAAVRDRFGGNARSILV